MAANDETADFKKRDWALPEKGFILRFRRFRIEGITNFLVKIFRIHAFLFFVIALFLPAQTSSLSSQGPRETESQKKVFSDPINTPSSSLKTEEYWSIEKWEDWVADEEPPAWLAVGSDDWAPPISAIEVGIHLESIHRLSHVDQTFGAIASVWSQWEGELKGWDGEPLGKSNPLELLQFNSIDSYDFSNGSNNPPYLSNGYYSSDVSIDGKFQTQLDYRLFPFDDQELVIEVTLDTDAYEAIIYSKKPPTASIAFNHILDYKLKEVRMQNLIKYHPTNYGIADYRENENFANSVVRIRIIIERIFLNSFFDYIFPLIAIALILILNASRFSTDISVKLTLPPASLLSIIFIQQFTNSQFPSISYLTFLDLIYIFVYGLVIICFLEASLSVYQRDTHDQYHEKIYKLRKLLKYLMALIFFAGPAISWIIAKNQVL